MKDLENHLKNVYKYNMVGAFYAAVISYGLGLCKTTWMELKRDISVQILRASHGTSEEIRLREMVKKPDQGHVATKRLNYD